MSLFFILALAVLSGAANAVQDKLTFHYGKSRFRFFKNQSFWNPAISSQNKYKDGITANGPAFFGSTTYLVFLTDAWHLFQFIELSAWQIALAVLMARKEGVETQLSEIVERIPFAGPYVYIILLFIAVKSAYSFTFEIFFKYILSK